MKVFDGIIVSVRLNRTAVVEVSRRTPHPLYRKLIRRSKKYKVDTTGFEPEIGSVARITETRPISKEKYFKITQILGEKNLVKQKSNTPKTEPVDEALVQRAKEKPVSKKAATKIVKKTIKKGAK